MADRICCIQDKLSYSIIFLYQGVDDHVRKDFCLMSIGLFFDLWCYYKQFLVMEKPMKNGTIDDAIPYDI